jgi:hypothetical protein
LPPQTNDDSYYKNNPTNTNQYTVPQLPEFPPTTVELKPAVEIIYGLWKNSYLQKA